MELLAMPEDFIGARALVASSILYAAGRKATAVRAIVSGRHPHLSVFRRAGFLRPPTRFSGHESFGVLVLNAGSVSPNDVLHADDWYISGADLDFM